MVTPPLETIPEETQTPPTPVRVTADPPKTKPATEKNPGRVASGKRLAERNCLIREAKKKEEAEAASAAAQPSSNTPAQPENTNKENSGISLMTMLGIGGLLVSAAKALWWINCRAAETAWDILEAPARARRKRQEQERRQRMAADQTENDGDDES